MARLVLSLRGITGATYDAFKTVERFVNSPDEKVVLTSNGKQCTLRFAYDPTLNTRKLTAEVDTVVKTITEWTE